VQKHTAQIPVTVHGRQSNMSLCTPCATNVTTTAKV